MRVPHENVTCNVESFHNIHCPSITEILNNIPHRPSSSIALGSPTNACSKDCTVGISSFLYAQATTGGCMTAILFEPTILLTTTTLAPAFVLALPVPETHRTANAIPRPTVSPTICLYCFACKLCLNILSSVLSHSLHNVRTTF